MTAPRINPPQEMTDAKLYRRDFAGSVGAGLLLSPFISLLGRDRQAHAAVKQVKRLVMFCTSGTYPPAWTPTVSGENISAFSAMTSASPRSRTTSS